MSLGIEVPKSPKEAGKTLRPGTLSYYIEVPKSPKDGTKILGPGTVAPLTAAAPAREENEGALAMAMVGRHRRRSGRSLPLRLLSFSHNPMLI